MSEKRKLISLRNIGVEYRQSRSLFRKRSYQALKDVSFDIYSGDSIGIIGRNGAGKSTLLRIISNVIDPDTGTHENYQATTTLLSLQAGFDQELSGRTNAVLNGMLLGFSYADVMQKLDGIIEFAELGQFIDNPVKTYSTGMRARLGFSVAHTLSPDVLCIDEALGVGDVEFSKKSTKVVREKLLSNQTVVLVSHQAEVIQELCNRAVWIEDGVSRVVGTPEEVISAYEEYMCRPASA
jgi:lipopolysaccharide transport system ATP-binding protein